MMFTQKKGTSENCSRGRRTTLNKPRMSTLIIMMVIRTEFLTEKRPMFISIPRFPR